MKITFIILAIFVLALSIIHGESLNNNEDGDFELLTRRKRQWGGGWGGGWGMRRRMMMGRWGGMGGMYPGMGMGMMNPMMMWG